jgi:hypothetical protein
MRRSLNVTRFITCLVALATACVPLFAEASARLEGRLTGAQPTVHLTTAVHQVDLAPGRIVLTTGEARRIGSGLTSGVLAVQGAGLEPGARYLVASGRLPVTVVRADASGRIDTRFEPGFSEDSHWLDQRLRSATLQLQVIELSSGRAVAAGSPAKTDLEGRRTPLCGLEPHRFGEAWTEDHDDGAFFGVLAIGLNADSDYDVLADGLLVATVRTGALGELEVMASDGDDTPFQLPDALVPASVIDTVEIIAVAGDQVVAMAGSFSDPCQDIAPEPVDAGGFPLCAPGSVENDPWAQGSFDWIVFEDGLEMAFVLGFGLPGHDPMTVLFDGIEVGQGGVGPVIGEFFLAFSSDPILDEIQLPDEVLPVSNVQLVEVRSGTETLLSGEPGGECDDIAPPHPVESAHTPLCPTAEVSILWGESHWTEWSDGREEFMVQAFALGSGTSVQLIVDGTDLGTFEVDSGGTLFLRFSSEASEPGSGHGHHHPLPLPDSIRPVSDIDLVDLVVDGIAVLSGSFQDGCEPPEPPLPVDDDATDLCPTDASAATWGEASWIVWDNGSEQLIVYAGGFMPATPLTLTVDDVDLGTFDASTWGDLFLVFGDAAGAPGHDGFPWGDQSLPLPDELRPVSGIDRVTVAIDDVIVLDGSFAEDCVPPEEPEPVDEDFTLLCPTDLESVAFGEAHWIEWSDGNQEFRVHAFGGDVGGALSLAVDGIDLGTFDIGPGGFLSVLFTTDIATPGDRPHDGGEIVVPLPEELTPVQDIDQIIVAGTDGPLLEGSFSDPCEPPAPPTPVEFEATELCPVSGVLVFGEAAWTVWDNGVEDFMVAAHGLDDGVTYEIIVDGIVVGTSTVDDGRHLWLALSSEPTHPDQLPLPPSIRPVDTIDQVGIRAVGGTDLVSGSFANPCSLNWTVDGDATALCSPEGLEIGTASWVVAAVNGSAVEQSIFILLWEVEDDRHAVAIDGIDVGLTEPASPWGLAVQGLVLGDRHGRPIPPELDPVSAIDQVVVQQSGENVATGSFATPCDDGINDESGNQNKNRHRTATF